MTGSSWLFTFGVGSISSGGGSGSGGGSNSGGSGDDSDSGDGSGGSGDDSGGGSGGSIITWKLTKLGSNMTNKVSHITAKSGHLSNNTFQVYSLKSSKLCHQTKSSNAYNEIKKIPLKLIYNISFTHRSPLWQLTKLTS